MYQDVDYYEFDGRDDDGNYMYWRESAETYNKAILENAKKDLIKLSNERDEWRERLNATVKRYLKAYNVDKSDLEDIAYELDFENDIWEF